MRTIPYKEDLITEFKSDLKRCPDNDLIDEIVGMANTKGGSLYLGVEDEGKIHQPIGHLPLILMFSLAMTMET
ncbi:ATP-binding protein [Eubacterium xylanophilum]|uniref:ATP-binding protein n=1 Tax=Eubacterium xylanophilum TaxID=39497 RepID=UPI00047E8485|nr:ATP-binding protein [Eubacterium xylanophilum]